MPGSDKKSRSRETFAAVFEEQTRRFSAFELLGLASNNTDTTDNTDAPAVLSTTSPPQTAEVVSREVESRVSEQALVLGSDSKAQGLRPDSLVIEQGSDQPIIHARRTLKKIPTPHKDSHTSILRPDSQSLDLRPDSPTVAQTLDPQQGQTPDALALGQSVRPSMGQTQDKKETPILGPDRRVQEHISDPFAPLLAPLQWAVWEALQEADSSSRTVSYRQLARQTHSTIDGVRKAVRVLQKEKGILEKYTVRSSLEQGFRVVVNRGISFRRGTLNETKAILKRGLALGQTSDRQGQGLGTDGLRMLVCRNTNIKQTDIGSLLRVPPPDWNIREQTLIQIADSLPEMTAIEFRLSLAYLVKQAKQAREPVRNPNAWVKAAFEKNGRPLVTEREIEARLDQHSVKRETKVAEAKGEGDMEELDLLRRYLACSVSERTEIDRIAKGKAASLFKIVSTDKHAGVMNAARLEAIREYFTK